jgi:hypothetical protein
MPGKFILDDLSAVFSTADFATAALVDGFNTVNGIFENQSEEIPTQDERVVMVRSAKFICPEAAPIRPGSTLEIDGTTYEAKTPDHDGTGVTTWYLKRIVD